MIKRKLSSHNVDQLINNISRQYHKPSHIIFTSRDGPMQNYNYNASKNQLNYMLSFELFYRISILIMIIFLITRIVKKGLERILI